MASTVLPNGIIIPEKYSRDWYADLYHNWQELDNLLAGGGGGGANDGTLTIQKNGTTVGTFSANQATDETINITVPDVNNGTLTIQKNGTTVDTFTANSSTDKTVNITVPTKTSDLTNDSNFVPSTDLATVATSGSYNDLSNKPTIPTVNNATLTIQQNGTNVQTFTANQSTNATANITVPTKTSDLTNDSGFIISDDTKIPLAGSNAISGDLIPATDNSIDIGSSTKNLKMLYTKGITINGTQFLPSDVLPTGCYIQFAGSQAPEGFLVCNGGEISRTTYSALFDVIGTTYGSGDGSATFNLPNLTDRFLQGSSTSGTVKDAGLPNILGSTAHSVFSVGVKAEGAAGAFTNTVYINNVGSTVGAQLGVESGYYGDFFDASRSSSIYGNSSTVQPPALTCLICIKY